MGFINRATLVYNALLPCQTLLRNTVFLRLKNALYKTCQDDINGTDHTPISFVLSQPSVRLVFSLSDGESVLRCTMLPNSLTKQSGVGKTTHEFFISRFSADESICPVSTAFYYMRRTEHPHQPTSACYCK